MASELHIVVMGAGSVGCFIGGAWLAAGCNLSFLGRESIRNELATHGLSVTDQNGWGVQLAPDRLKVSTKPAALKTADVIALCVKSTGTEAAAREIARHARAGATVISFQNGVTNAETLRTALPKFKAVQGMVPYNVVRLGPGRWHRATWGELTAERTDVTSKLAAILGNRPGKLLLSDDMAGIAWGKLLLNLNNAVNALSGLTLVEELGQRDYRRVLAAAIVEALELLREAGIQPAKIGEIPPSLLPHAIGAPDFVFKNLFMRVQKIDPKARSSMADDLSAGRPTEIDYLNGEVVKLARRLGRSAPVNQAIVQLVKGAELGVERTWSAPELRAHVLERHRSAAGFGY